MGPPWEEGRGERDQLSCSESCAPVVFGKRFAEIEANVERETCVHKAAVEGRAGSVRAEIGDLGLRQREQVARAQPDRLAVRARFEHDRLEPEETLVYAPPLHSTFGTAPLHPLELSVLAPFPPIVCSADELRRLPARRRRAASAPTGVARA